MAINVEMFKRIEETITAHPKQHDQHFFEAGEEGSCGTTRCVAGWAIHLWGMDNGLSGPLEDLKEEYIDRYGAARIAAEQDIEHRLPDHLHEYIDSDHVGASILGLDPEQGYDLFFNMDNGDALRMVRSYARGGLPVRSDPWT